MNIIWIILIIIIVVIVGYFLMNYLTESFEISSLGKQPFLFSIEKPSGNLAPYKSYAMGMNSISPYLSKYNWRVLYSSELLNYKLMLPESYYGIVANDQFNAYNVYGSTRPLREGAGIWIFGMKPSKTDKEIAMYLLPFSIKKWNMLEKFMSIFVYKKPKMPAKQRIIYNQ